MIPAGRLLVVGALWISSHAADAGFVGPWRAVPSGTPEMLREVGFAEGRWVAVGLNATIVTSTNGLDWQRVPLEDAPADLALMGVAGNRNGWVATAVDSVLRSTNGLSWTVHPAPNGTSLTKIAAGPDGWVAIGFRIEGQGSSSAALYSTNGVDWVITHTISSSADLPWQMTHNSFSAVAYGDGDWVLLSNYSDRQTFRTTAHHSTDGRNWAPGTGAGSGSLADGPSAFLSSVAHGPDGWKALGTGLFSFAMLITSPDGRDWRDSNQPLPHSIRQILASGGGTWLMALKTGVWEVFSMDPASPKPGWIKRNQGTDGTESFNAIAFGRDRWVVVGDQGLILCSGFPPTIAGRPIPSEGVFRGSIVAPPNQLHRIQVTEDLSHWRDLPSANAVPSDGVFEDASTPSSNFRFYRAVAR